MGRSSRDDVSYDRIRIVALECLDVRGTCIAEKNLRLFLFSAGTGGIARLFKLSTLRILKVPAFLGSFAGYKNKNTRRDAIT